MMTIYPYVNTFHVLCGLTPVNAYVDVAWLPSSVSSTIMNEILRILPDAAVDDSCISTPEIHRRLACIQSEFSVVKTVQRWLERLLDEGLSNAKSTVYQTRSRQREAASRTVFPLGMVECGGLVYLIVGIEKHPNSPAMYRLDRLKQSEMQPEGLIYCLAVCGMVTLSQTLLW